jgi:hypothetical protein
MMVAKVNGAISLTVILLRGLVMKRVITLAFLAVSLLFLPFHLSVPNRLDGGAIITSSHPYPQQAMAADFAAESRYNRYNTKITINLHLACPVSSIICCL